MGTVIKRSLAGHEDIIESGLKSFIDVGTSLAAIRDEQLFKGKYDNFEHYCKARWGFAKSRAYQYIEAANVTKEISTIVETDLKKTGGKSQIPLPQNEGQVRALADVSDDAETRAQVWQAAVEQAPKDAAGQPKVTAKVVKEVAATIVEPKPEQKADDGPQVEDEFGPVAPRFRAVFALVSEFRGLVQKIGRIQSEIEDLQRSDAGAFIPVKEIVKHCEEMQRAVKFSTPHCECPRCKRKPQESCKVCNGLGWLNQPTFTRSKTKEDEQWLLSRS